MRHLKHNHLLGVKKQHRSALLANIGSALIIHGQISTTLAKAKAVRPFVEKIITFAKKSEGAKPEVALHYSRLAMARLRNKNAVKVLFNDKVSEFTNRQGGYTRIYKLGTRIGDAAEMALIQLISADDEGYSSNKRKKKVSIKEQNKKISVKEEKTDNAEATNPVEEISETKAAE